MKNSAFFIIKIILIWAFSFSVFSDQYKACIDNVVDGDTYDGNIIILDKDSNPFSINFSTYQRIRLRNFDTPETWRPKTESEKQHGEQAKEFVKNLILNKCVVLLNPKTAVYNRIEADIILSNGESLTNLLLLNSFEKRQKYE